MNDASTDTPDPGRGDRATGTPVRRVSLMPPPRSTRHRGRRRTAPIIVAAVVALLVVGGGASVWALRGQSESAEETGVPDSYTGTWEGQVGPEDHERAAEGTLTVKLESGARRGTAELAPTGCRGSLKGTERDGATVVLDYIETYDPEQRCADESELRLGPGDSDGTLGVRWSADTPEDGTAVSTGTLRSTAP